MTPRPPANPSPAASAAPASPSRTERTLLIVGDSISLGATEVFGNDVLSRVTRTFVQILQEIDPGRKLAVDAVVRRTTTEAVSVLPALLAQHRPEIALLMLGGNDVDLNWRRFIVSNGTRIVHNVEVARFEENLRRLVEESREAGVVPVLSDLPSLDLPGRTHWLSGKSGVDVQAIIAAINANGEAEVRQRLLAYNGAITRVATDYNVPVARWAAELPGMPADQRFGPDALHPGEGVHPVIAKVVAALLRQIDASPLPVPSGAAHRVSGQVPA